MGKKTLIYFISARTASIIMIGNKRYMRRQTIPVMILSADFISFIRRRVLEEEKCALEQYLISDWQDGWGKRWSTRVGSRRVRIRGRAKGGKAGWWWGGQSFWGNPFAIGSYRIWIQSFLASSILISLQCNICLDTARDAVVSMCGHLFCWPCLHQVLNNLTFVLFLEPSTLTQLYSHCVKHSTQWLETRPNRQICPVCKVDFLECFCSTIPLILSHCFRLALVKIKLFLCMVGVILMAKIPGGHWVCSLSIVTIFLLLTTCKHREKVPPRPQGQRAEPTTNNPFSGPPIHFTNIVDSFWALSELCFFRIRLWGRPAWGLSHVLRYRWE